MVLNGALAASSFMMALYLGMSAAFSGGFGRKIKRPTISNRKPIQTAIQSSLV
jgi:hypothetical protein